MYKNYRVYCTSWSSAEMNVTCSQQGLWVSSGVTPIPSVLLPMKWRLGCKAERKGLALCSLIPSSTIGPQTTFYSNFRTQVREYKYRGKKHVGEVLSLPLIVQSIFSFHRHPEWKGLIRIGWIFHCCNKTECFQKKNKKLIPQPPVLFFSSSFPLYQSLQRKGTGETQPVALPSLWRLELEDLHTEKPITTCHSSFSCCKTRRIVITPFPKDAGHGLPV